MGFGEATKATTLQVSPKMLGGQIPKSFLSGETLRRCQDCSVKITPCLLCLNPHHQQNQKERKRTPKSLRLSNLKDDSVVGDGLDDFTTSDGQE